MFVFIKEAVEVMPPFTHLAVRFAAAALVMAVWAFASAGAGFVSKSLLRDGVILGVWLFLGFASQTYGVHMTSVANAGFITGFNIVLVPLLGMWVWKTKPGKPALLGIAVAVVGIALLTLGGAEPPNLGDFLVLICAFAFSVHILLTGAYTSRHHPVALAFVQIAAVSVCNAVAAFFFEDWKPALSPEVLGSFPVVRAILIGALFATAFAYWAQTYFQRFTTPVRTALIFASEPVFAAASGMILAGEVLTVQAVAGSLLILGGILISELRGSGGSTQNDKVNAA